MGRPKLNDPLFGGKPLSVESLRFLEALLAALVAVPGYEAAAVREGCRIEFRLNAALALSLVNPASRKPRLLIPYLREGALDKLLATTGARHITNASGREYVLDWVHEAPLIAALVEHAKDRASRKLPRAKAGSK